MDPAISRINEFRQELGCVANSLRIHCNAHIEPSLMTKLTNALLKIEAVLGMKTKFQISIYQNYQITLIEYSLHFRLQVSGNLLR